MKEDFLHYLWKHKKFNLFDLKTAHGEQVEVIRTGEHNLLEGPDFFNAQVIINGQRWAGNVELHIRASEWYAHSHEGDANYDNTILHVVWENDMDVYGSNDRPLPTLILKDFIEPCLIDSYKNLFDNRSTSFNNCEDDFGEVPRVLVEDWLERLYLERLERKVTHIDMLLKQSNNDWEAVFFKMLARNFGTKINGDAFEALAGSIPFKMVRKMAKTPGGLETFFFGAAQLLPEDSVDEQVLWWKREYHFLKSKYDLDPFVSVPLQFFRLRPANFPTIRLSQLAAVYEQEDRLFAKAMKISTVEAFYELFSVKASSYWDTHYNFDKKQPKRAKKGSKNFIDLLLINTVIPLKFAHNKRLNQNDPESVLHLICQISAEKNKITDRFYSMGDMPKNALMSQGLIQLKNEYCDKNQCLKCRVGNYLIDPAAVR